MGARNRDINLVILSQATTSAIIGFTSGVAITFLMRGAIIQAGVPMQTPWPLFAVLFIIILFTCLSAALHIGTQGQDTGPVTVFRE